MLIITAALKQGRSRVSAACGLQSKSLTENNNKITAKRLIIKNVSVCGMYMYICTCVLLGGVYMQLRWPRVNTQHRLLSLSAWVFKDLLLFVYVHMSARVCVRICTVSDHRELELLSVLHHQHGCWELIFSLLQELSEPGAHPSSRLACPPDS